MAFLPPMETVPHRWEFSDYLNPAFLQRLRKDRIHSVFELGCHDGEDTLRLREAFQAPLHAFECHPRLLERARARCSGHADITLVGKAAWDADGTIPFYPVVRTTQNGAEIDNCGASSCFRARTDYHRLYEQEEIRVEAIRMDTYCRQAGLAAPDLLCLDVQGATRRALAGWGELLRGIRYVISEIEHQPIYHGQDLLPEVHAVLSRAGFYSAVRVTRDAWFNDYLYINMLLED